MENFALHAITTELAGLLTGRRIIRTVQVGTTDIAIDFNLRDGRWLFISTDPTRLAFHLTSLPVRRLDARTDTSFISLFGKYAAGSIVRAIGHLGYDRVIHVSLVADTGDDEGQREIVVQLTGRSANILVVENNRINASLRESSTPKATYSDPPPPAEKLDPFDCSRERLASLITSMDGDIAAAARLHLIGFGIQYAEELAARSRHLDPYDALKSLLNDLYTEAPKPTVYSSGPLDKMEVDPGNCDFAVTYAPIELESCSHLLAAKFESVNKAADAVHLLLERRRSFNLERAKVVSQIQSRLKKLVSLHRNLCRERDQFGAADLDQKYGELLMANIQSAEKNDQIFRVRDYFDEAQGLIDIPGLSQATAKDAAEQYFKRARKARNGLKTITARLPEIEKQIEILNKHVETLHRITRFDDLKELKDTAGLEDKPAAPGRGQKLAVGKRAAAVPGTRRYRSSDGFEILVGRTSRDNDYLTTRVAKSYDLWFHAADYGGSHVVLRNPKRGVVSPTSILEAAQLAAKFSQANNETGAKVAVNYCEKKFVTKPKGFNPGQVRLSSYKTILVEPREAGTRIENHG